MPLICRGAACCALWCRIPDYTATRRRASPENSGKAIDTAASPAYNAVEDHSLLPLHKPSGRVSVCGGAATALTRRTPPMLKHGVAAAAQAEGSNGGQSDWKGKCSEDKNIDSVIWCDCLCSSSCRAFLRRRRSRGGPASISRRGGSAAARAICGARSSAGGAYFAVQPLQSVQFAALIAEDKLCLRARDLSRKSGDGDNPWPP